MALTELWSVSGQAVSYPEDVRRQSLVAHRLQGTDAETWCHTRIKTLLGHP